MDKVYVIRGMICILVIVTFIYYYFICKRKIVSVYSPESYFGLGDYIRGVIHLYQNEGRNAIYVNYETHEIAKYLHNAYGNNSSFEKEKIQITDEKSFPDIEKVNDDLYLYHNAGIQYPIDKNILKKVRQIFDPKPEFKHLIDEEIFNITGGKEFIILHVRLNDDVFVTDRELDNLELNAKILKLVSTNTQIIIMSNSNLTKNKLSVRYGLKFINVIPAHTGAIGVKGDIKDTMLEFFIMSKAKHIYQFCETKGQKSGFSQRISEIYDIPLIKINE